MTGAFLITILASNPDRTEFYLANYITPFSITEIRQARIFAYEISEVCFEHIKGAKVEKVSVKKVSEAQL